MARWRDAPLAAPAQKAPAGGSWRDAPLAPGSAMPPAGLKPGSKEYADWAVEQAKAGKKLPQVSPTPPEPEAWGDKGVILPIERDAISGKTRLAVPQIVDSIIDAIKLPGDVLAGSYDEELDPRKGIQPSPDLIGRTLNTSGLMTGTAPVAAAVKVGAKVAGKAPLSKFARREVSRALDADSAFDGSGAAAIGAAGDRGMLADAGPNAAALLDTAIQHSGKGAKTAREAIEARAGAVGDDLTMTLDRVLGEPEGKMALTKEIRDSTAEARRTAYDAAYGKPIDYSSDAGRQIEEVLKRVPKEAIVEANALMRAEGVGSKHIMANIADDGTVTFRTMPDVRQLDYIKRGLGQVVESTEDKGAMGGLTTKGKIYNNLARDLKNATGSAVPEYHTALETAADPITRSKAVQFGADLLSAKIPRDVAEDTIGSMSGPELAALKQGVRSRFDETMANVKRVASDPNLDARQARAMLADISSDAARDKLRMAVGEEADELFKVLDEAEQSLQMRASVSRNSATFARTSLDQAIGERVAGGVRGKLMEGKPVAAGQAAVQKVTGRSPAALRGKKEKIYAEIAQALTEKRGEEAVRLLRQLDPQAQRERLSNSPLLRKAAFGSATLQPTETAKAITNFVNDARERAIPGPK